MKKESLLGAINENGEIDEKKFFDQDCSMAKITTTIEIPDEKKKGCFDQEDKIFGIEEEQDDEGLRQNLKVNSIPMSSSYKVTSDELSYENDSEFKDFLLQQEQSLFKKPLNIQYKKLNFNTGQSLYQTISSIESSNLRTCLDPSRINTVKIFPRIKKKFT
jgi:hypothetical protein